MSKLKFLPILFICGTAAAQNTAPCPNLTGAYGSFICNGARTTIRQQEVAGGTAYELNNDGKPQSLVANGQPQTITTSKGPLRITTVCAPAYKPGITTLLKSNATVPGSNEEQVTWMFVENKALMVLKFQQKNGVQVPNGKMRCGPDVPSARPPEANPAPGTPAPTPAPAPKASVAPTAPPAATAPPTAVVRPAPTGPVPPADIPQPSAPRSNPGNDGEDEE